MDYFVDTQTIYDTLVDPGFPRERQLLRPTYYFVKVLPETAWKWKNLDPPLMVKFSNLWTCECEILFMRRRYKCHIQIQAQKYNHFFMFTQFLANFNDGLVLRLFEIPQAIRRQNSRRITIRQIWKSRLNGWMVIWRLFCLRITQGSHSDWKTWKTWKNGKAFSSQGKVREFWTDWKSQGKVRENHTKYWKTQGIWDEYYLIFLYIIFSDI